MFNNHRSLDFRRDIAKMLGMTIEKAEEAGYIGNPACDTYRTTIKRKSEQKKERRNQKKRALTDRTNISD